MITMGQSLGVFEADLDYTCTFTGGGAYARASSCTATSDAGRRAFNDLTSAVNAVESKVQYSKVRVTDGVIDVELVGVIQFIIGTPEAGQVFSNALVERFTGASDKVLELANNADVYASALSDLSGGIIPRAKRNWLFVGIIGASLVAALSFAVVGMRKKKRK